MQPVSLIRGMAECFKAGLRVATKQFGFTLARIQTQQYCGDPTTWRQ
jgi:hypothetical protein